MKLAAAACASGAIAFKAKPAGSGRREETATRFGQGMIDSGTGGLAGTG